MKTAALQTVNRISKTGGQAIQLNDKKLLFSK
jgi:hypothetical protein